jgi:signal transduction histidine kinase
LTEFEVLDGDAYYDLLKDEDFKEYFDHDLKNISGKILTIIEILSEMNGRRFSGDNFNLLLAVEENWPYYSLVMEDILTRKLEQEPSFKRKPKEVDMVFVDRALSGFKKDLSSKAVSPTKYERESSKDESKKVQPVGTINSLKGVLSNDEYVDVPGSLIINSIFNVLRNGCAIHVDAREGGVNLSVKKLGTDLVIRVVDNGIGLSGNQLDPENEKFIFNKGKQKSRRGSTGLGLAHLDKRMERGGGMIRVASRKRGQTVDEMHTYPTKIDEREWKILKKLYKQVITQLYLNGACLLRKKN